MRVSFANEGARGPNASAVRENNVACSRVLTTVLRVRTWAVALAEVGGALVSTRYVRTEYRPLQTDLTSLHNRDVPAGRLEVCSSSYIRGSDHMQASQGCELRDLDASRLSRES